MCFFFRVGFPGARREAMLGAVQSAGSPDAGSHPWPPSAKSLRWPGARSPGPQHRGSAEAEIAPLASHCNPKRTDNGTRRSLIATGGVHRVLETNFSSNRKTLERERTESWLDGERIHADQIQKGERSFSARSFWSVLLLCGPGRMHPRSPATCPLPGKPRLFASAKAKFKCHTT